MTPTQMLEGGYGRTSVVLFSQQLYSFGRIQRVSFVHILLWYELLLTFLFQPLAQPRCEAMMARTTEQLPTRKVPPNEQQPRRKLKSLPRKFDLMVQ